RPSRPASDGARGRRPLRRQAPNDPTVDVSAPSPRRASRWSARGPLSAIRNAQAHRALDQAGAPGAGRPGGRLNVVSPSGKSNRVRGVFERVRGSGVWSVRYTNAQGRRHREQGGPRKLAISGLHRRLTGVKEQRFFPENIRRRDVVLKDFLVSFHRDHVDGKLKNAKHYAQYGDRWRKALGSKTLRQIVPGDIARYAKQRRNDGMAAATINREL